MRLARGRVRVRDVELQHTKAATDHQRTVQEAIRGLQVADQELRVEGVASRSRRRVRAEQAVVLQLQSQPDCEVAPGEIDRRRDEKKSVLVRVGELRVLMPGVEE